MRSLPRLVVPKALTGQNQDAMLAPKRVRLTRLHSQMDAPALSSSKIVYYLETESAEEITNMVFLLCCYLVLELDFSPHGSVSM